MLLGQKKNQEREQNWSLVLNPVSNEIDKHKLAQKISGTFKLSLDESLDLVSNTPIILLDNLSRPVAAQVKDYFGTVHAELFLTNDVYVKRKCYRTVWPDPPSLSFLEALQAVGAGRETGAENRPLAPDEALHELRSLRKDSQSERPAPAPKEPARAPAAEGRLKELDQEILKLKTLLKNAEHKYEGIQEEYRQARGLYESKVASAQDDARKWKAKLEEGLQKARRSEEERLQGDHQIREAGDKARAEAEELRGRCRKLEEALQSRDAALYDAAEKARTAEESRREAAQKYEDQALLTESWLSRFEREQALRTEETARLSQENALLRAKAEEAQSASDTYQRKAQELENNSARREEELAGWQARSENLSHEIDKLRLLLGDEKILKDKLADRLSQAEDERNSLRGSLNEAQVRLQSLQGEYQSVRTQLEREKYSAQTLGEQLRGEAAALAEKNEHLEKSRLRLLKEIEDAGRQADEWKLKAKDFEHALKDLEQKTAAQEEAVRTQRRLLEDRERELETNRRQVRELAAQLEQRDLIHRRAQLAEQLAMKEERLKSLIQEQSQLESEMHHKEEKMRAILGEQERIEKEIVESKQAQRHYLEQAKREKPAVKIGRPAQAEPRKPAAAEGAPSQPPSSAMDAGA